MGEPIYYNGKFVPFLDEFVSYKGELFAIAKDEDGLIIRCIRRVASGKGLPSK